MPSPRVLQIRRSDETDSHVLLHVWRSDPTVLDLHLAATEGESPYTTTLTQSRLQNARTHNYRGSDQDWQETVLAVLGLQDGPTRAPALLKGVEASASITGGDDDDDKQLVITIKQRIETITQKLGSLILLQDDEHNIELFEWSKIAITRADDLEACYNTLLNRFRSAEDTIKLLNKQIEEFLSTKTQHEQQLMWEFLQLLNEKKLKIRNQQRLLSSARADPGKLSKMQAIAAINSPSQNLQERNSKRPVGTSADENDSEDGSEQINVDHSRQVIYGDIDQGIDNDGRSTAQPLEDEYSTSSEDGGSSLSDLHLEKEKEWQGISQRTAAKSFPPKRELPFTRKPERETATVRTSPAQEDLDETGGETDDDEL